jgi:hypothetical protein
LALATASQLQSLDAAFAPADFPADPPAVGAGARAALALVGWSVAAVHGAAPPALAHTVARLDAGRRHLGVGLAGVGAWVPTPAELDALRCRLSLRDRDAVRELLRASADSVLDFGALAARPAPPEVGLADAMADLSAVLAAPSRDGPRVARAREAHRAAVERELVGPLARWALAARSPVTRAVGFQLTQAAGLLHRIGPALADAPGGSELTNYLAAAALFGRLLRDLRSAREAGQ